MGYLRCPTITVQIAGWVYEAPRVGSAYPTLDASNSIQNFDTFVSCIRTNFEKIAFLLQEITAYLGLMSRNLLSTDI
jgi:hypothetical protein